MWNNDYEKWNSNLNNYNRPYYKEWKGYRGYCKENVYKNGIEDLIIIGIMIMRNGIVITIIIMDLIIKDGEDIKVMVERMYITNGIED